MARLEKMEKKLLRDRKITISCLYVDLKKIIKEFQHKGVCDGAGRPLPLFQYLRLPQSEINKKANIIIRGLCNW